MFFFSKKSEVPVENNVYYEISKPYEHLFKKILVGDCGVGKSTILQRYIDSNFNHQYTPTIGIDFTSKIIEVNNTKIKLHIWDTAGQERFRSISKIYYNNAYAHILVFDLSDFNTLQNLTYWIREIFMHADKINLFLIGTKKDLYKENPQKKHMIQNFITEHNILDYFEISAKKDKDISHVFEKISEKLLEIKKKEEQILEQQKLNLKTVPEVKPFGCC